MTYNPKAFERIQKIPPNELVEGVIIDIKDGTPKILIKDQNRLTKFENAETPAIMLTIEFKYKSRVFRIEQLFSYIAGENNKVLFTDGSNMGKYFASYGKMPEVSDVVKLKSNAQGFFKLIL